MLQFKSVEPKALGLLKEINSFPEFGKFYLVGGTALALHYGHRLSVDLDFFTDITFENSIYLNFLSEKYKIETMNLAKNSITISINSIKVDFIRHNFPLISPIENDDNILIASTKDIAAMKLNSVMNRGSKKDFFDIDELLNHYSLNELITFYSIKYNTVAPVLLLKSLTYFQDAEAEPNPVSLSQREWNDIKTRITEEVTKFTL